MLDPDDGTWQMCPYCGELIDLYVDPGGSRTQRYVEDCSVCCRPIDVFVSLDEDGGAQVSLRRQDE
ncbi:CPXCG motif-containing cysteine-rich protein [Haliangium ochraceum]|uniref:CPXCG motif-containing cysteine-rich protein n=1 Tax=Haliangium ochraceum (strain DSM 14365 / JCM 11303 / SMP-2) TaxID=502025 RepID=D0LMH6_HALO1|nr:CPXCG motif-containing cysteine-rich protein [Haliangium ochraceum]ACY18663.1 conserved hypothetical protein [Haliangium ochraceum DSM 14365]